MSMTIGRFSTTEDPYAGSLRISGDTLSFSSDTGAASKQEVQAKIQQLNGLVNNPDEDVFPFTWTEDPSMSGYYRITSVSVDPADVYLVTGFCMFSITMQRIPSFGAPLFECLSQGLVRTNAFSITAPAGVQFSAPGPSGGAAIDANVSFSRFPTFSGTTLTTGVFYPFGPASAQFSIKTPDFYNASVLLEVSYDSGTTWWPAVGQQVPNNTVPYWRISNGWVRMSPDVANSTSSFSFMKIEYGDGSGTYTLNSNAVGWNSTTLGTNRTWGVPADIGTFRVLRNSPEQVTIRTSAQSILHDWTIRRADWWVDVAVSSTTGGTNLGFAVSGDTNNPVTTTPGALYAGAYDSGGGNWSISSPQACSSLHSGISSAWFTTAVAQYAQFALCPRTYRVGATPAVGYPNAAATATVRDGFFAARSERQRVITR